MYQPICVRLLTGDHQLLRRLCSSMSRLRGTCHWPKCWRQTSASCIICATFQMTLLRESEPSSLRRITMHAGSLPQWMRCALPPPPPPAPLPRPTPFILVLNSFRPCKALHNVLKYICVTVTPCCQAGKHIRCKFAQGALLSSQQY